MQPNIDTKDEQGSLDQLVKFKGELHAVLKGGEHANFSFVLRNMLPALHNSVRTHSLTAGTLKLKAEHPPLDDSGHSIVDVTVVVDDRPSTRVLREASEVHRMQAQITQNVIEYIERAYPEPEEPEEKKGEPVKG